MAGQGFRVDPDKLLEVANQVQQLKDDLSGVGSVAGSLPQYRTKADASVLRSALSSFWVGEDVFATAYEREHNGIVATMTSMLGQLEALERACRSTANQYRTQETKSATEVSRTRPEAWS